MSSLKERHEASQAEAASAHEQELAGALRHRKIATDSASKAMQNLKDLTAKYEVTTASATSDKAASEQEVATTCDSHAAECEDLMAKQQQAADDRASAIQEMTTMSEAHVEELQALRTSHGNDAAASLPAPKAKKAPTDLVKPVTFTDVKHEKKKCMLIVSTGGLEVLEDNKKAKQVGIYEMHELSEWKCPKKKKDYFEVTMADVKTALAFETKDCQDVKKALQAVADAVEGWNREEKQAEETATVEAAAAAKEDEEQDEEVEEQEEESLESDMVSLKDSHEAALAAATTAKEQEFVELQAALKEAQDAHASALSDTEAMADALDDSESAHGETKAVLQVALSEKEAAAAAMTSEYAAEHATMKESHQLALSAAVAAGSGSDAESAALVVKLQGELETAHSKRKIATQTASNLGQSLKDLKAKSEVAVTTGSSDKVASEQDVQTMREAHTAELEAVRAGFAANESRICELLDAQLAEAAALEAQLVLITQFEKPDTVSPLLMEMDELRGARDAAVADTEAMADALDAAESSATEAAAVSEAALAEQAVALAEAAEVAQADAASALAAFETALAEKDAALEAAKSELQQVSSAVAAAELSSKQVLDDLTASHSSVLEGYVSELESARADDTAGLEKIQASLTGSTDEVEAALRAEMIELKAASDSVRTELAELQAAHSVALEDNEIMADSMVEAETQAATSLEQTFAEHKAAAAAMETKFTSELGSLRENHEEAMATMQSAHQQNLEHANAVPSEGVPGEPAAITVEDDDDDESEALFSSEPAAAALPLVDASASSHEAEGLRAELDASRAELADAYAKLEQHEAAQLSSSVDADAACVRVAELEVELKAQLDLQSKHAASIAQAQTEAAAAATGRSAVQLVTTHEQSKLKLELESAHAAKEEQGREMQRLKDELDEFEQQLSKSHQLPAVDDDADAPSSKATAKASAALRAEIEDLRAAQVVAVEAAEATHAVAMASVEASLKEKFNTKFKEKLAEKKEKSDGKMKAQKAKMESKLAAVVAELEAARAELAQRSTEMGQAMAAAQIQRTYRKRDEAKDRRAVVQASLAQVAAANAKLEVLQTQQSEAASVPTEPPIAESPVEEPPVEEPSTTEGLAGALFADAGSLFDDDDALAEPVPEQGEATTQDDVTAVQANVLQLEASLAAAVAASEAQEAQFGDMLANLSAGKSKAISELKEAHVAELDALRVAHADELASVRSSANGPSKAELWAEVEAALGSTHAEGLTEVTEEAQAQLSKLRSVHESALSKMTEGHSADLATATVAAEQAAARAETLRQAALEDKSAATSAAAAATGGVYKAVEVEVQQLRDAHQIEIDALRSSIAKREALTESRYIREIGRLQAQVERLEPAAGEGTGRRQTEQQVQQQKQDIEWLKAGQKIGTAQLSGARQELSEARAALWAANQQLHGGAAGAAGTAQIATLKRIFAAKHAGIILRLEEEQQASIAEAHSARDTAEATSAHTLAELMRLRQAAAEREERKHPPTGGSWSPGASTDAADSAVVDAVFLAPTPGHGLQLELGTPGSMNGTPGPAGGAMGDGERCTLAVRSGSGEYKRLTATSLETVGSVKIRVAALLGAPSSGRVLVYNYRVLDDSRTLAECGVGDKAVVRLELHSARKTNVILKSLKADRKA